MGKDKKKDKSLNGSKIEEENGDEMSYEDRLEHVSIIAKPMATKKLAKKVNTYIITIYTCVNVLVLKKLSLEFYDLSAYVFQ